MPKILIVVEDGRLGNQIFQYFAIKNLFENYIVIFCGFSSLLNLFPNLSGNFIVCKKNKFNKFLLRLIIIIKKHLIKFKIFSVVEEVYSNKYSYLKISNGKCNKILITKNSYFQSIKFLDLSMVDNFIKNKYVNYSDAKNRKIFIHIRKGDYQYWPSKKYPAVLPLEWYIEAIKKMSNLYPDSKFLVFTDDLKYTISILPLMQNNVPNTFQIIHGDEFLDFLGMTECFAGILSPSSFSWWASYFSVIKHMRGDALFVAPNYWAGHLKQEWFPCEEIRAPWIEYLEVKNNFFNSECC